MSMYSTSKISYDIKYQKSTEFLTELTDFQNYEGMFLFMSQSKFVAAVHRAGVRKCGAQLETLLRGST